MIDVTKQIREYNADIAEVARAFIARRHALLELVFTPTGVQRPGHERFYKLSGIGRHWDAAYKAYLDAAMHQVCWSRSRAEVEEIDAVIVTLGERMAVIEKAYSEELARAKELPATCEEGLTRYFVAMREHARATVDFTTLAPYSQAWERAFADWKRISKAIAVEEVKIAGQQTGFGWMTEIMKRQAAAEKLMRDNESTFETEFNRLRGMK